MTRLITNASVLIFVVAVACDTATAQSTTQTGRDQKYVIIGTTSKTVGYMGPWIGKIKGFFQAEGVRAVVSSHFKISRANLFVIRFNPF